jgi:hypothetical protein
MMSVEIFKAKRSPFCDILFHSCIGTITIGGFRPAASRGREF